MFFPSVDLALLLADPTWLAIGNSRGTDQAAIFARIATRAEVAPRAGVIPAIWLGGFDGTSWTGVLISHEDEAVPGRGRLDAPLKVAPDGSIWLTPGEGLLVVTP